MERFPVVCEGQASGEAEAVQERLYVRLTVRTAARNGLWCAWAVGDVGEVRIGVLEPSAGESVITRRVSGRTLAEAGRLERVEIRRAGETWRRAGRGERVFRSARFQRQLKDAEGALTRQDGDRRRVALAREDGQPFPVPELFCLARAARIGTRDYWVFTFDAEGKPVL